MVMVLQDGTNGLTINASFHFSDHSPSAFPMDKLRAMQTFVRIVDSGSLRAAAESLDSSPPAVVRMLAALEQALGVRLLHRTTRRLALSEEGRDYLAHCRQVLAAIEQAEAELSARRQQPSGRLALTAPVQFGRLHVGPVLNGFLAAHPAMHAELLLLDRVVDLLEEGLDLAIRIGELPDSSLIAVPLGHTPRIVCASPAYLATHGRPDTPDELAGHHGVHFSGLGQGPEWTLSRGRQTVKRTLPCVLSTNQVDTALAAAEAGLGLVRVLGYQAAEALAAGRLVRVLQDAEPPPRPVQLLHPAGRRPSSRLRAFMDWGVPVLRQRLAALMPG